MGAEIEKPWKKTSKVIIPNRLGHILLLTRSELEDSRVGMLDFVGGQFDEGEDDPLKVLLRESDREIPGSELYNVTPVTPAEGMVTLDSKGREKVTHVFAANARL